MKNILIIYSILIASIGYSQSQDSLATVYFYREGKLAGFAVGYDIKHNDTVVGRIKSKSAFSYRCKPGLQSFKATTESESSIKLDIKPGQTYFIECGLGVGVFLGRPTFRQTFSEQAKQKITRIESEVANEIPEKLVETNVPTDTIRALNNLFQRKRKGGGTRAAIFGALGVYVLVKTASYQPETININGQIIQIGSPSPPVGNYLVVGLSVIMTISGISQTQKFSSKNLDILLDLYKKGRPLPQAIKIKLKKKDFK